ncbi:RNA helicase [Parenemella sanctibonifatiensis]|uniref:RNA helicase n=1 Tax=Parenemella sanctibonifatiensis TaxID=2016505 RepID=A0A255ENJ3_9ACTN|nr:RNA helicase [Parenemella sanctibonifatiensis]
MPSFVDLGVPAPLVEALDRRGITSPTPIQAATLPDALAGRDVLGRGRTGSGKTFAFLLPLIARLTQTPTKPRAQRPRALILAPTRELVTQIDESFQALASGTGLTSRVVFGGVGQNPQVSALRRGVDIVIACPGRLEDLMRQGHVRLDDIAISILDEADHMADLGFLPGVKRILDQTPSTGQRLLFSATLDAGVNVLVKRYLHRPVTHEADSAQSPVTAMKHQVLRVRPDDHLDVLADLAAAPGRTIVFARTKHRAKTLARKLNARGIPAVELHGNLSQNARQRTMTAFHDGTASTLVATDIAARGIHVDDVALVIHADPPVEHKAYLHRSGRTARAGAAGTVITLMTPDQNGDVRSLMRKAGIKAPSTDVQPGHAVLTDLAPGERTYPGAWKAPAPATPPARPAKGSNRPAKGGRPAKGSQGSSQHQSRSSQSGRNGGRSGGSGGSGRSGGTSRQGRNRGGASGSRGHSASRFSAGR